MYDARKEDLDDAKRKDVIIRFLQGSVMGFEFARANPRAAAQITYRQFPGLKKQMTPQLAVDSFSELASAYGIANRQGKGWGYAPIGGWQRYLEIIHDLGQTKQKLQVSNVVTNELIAQANSGADVKRATSDAARFKLDADFSKTTPARGVKL